MTDLPEINGNNALMVVVDKFGKLNRLVPCRVGSQHRKLRSCFLTIGLDSLVYHGMSYKTATYILLRPFGRHYGVYWVHERCLAVLTTLRLMVRLSGRNVPLRRSLERLRMKAIIGYKLLR